MKVAPSGESRRWLISSRAKEETRLGQVIASKVASLRDSCFNDRGELLPIFSIYSVTWRTSHVYEYRGLGGRLLRMPFMRLRT